MARNYSNNSNEGGGCLFPTIGILLLIGNVGLFDGLFDELPLVYMLIIIADVFIIGASIKAIFGKSSKNTPSQVLDAQPISQQLNTRDITPSDPKDISIANEDKSKLNQLMAKYRVPTVTSVDTIVDPLQKEMESCQCIEVLQNINKAISRRKTYAKKMNSIKEEIDGILACPMCGTDREKFKFIKKNEDVLQQKKDEYATISAEMKNVKVNLLSKEITIFNRFFSALTEIVSSEKSLSESGVALFSFIKLRSSIPGDLFYSEQSPIELDYAAYRFFLFPDVVLAYDKADTFVTAFEPLALIITITDQKKRVYMQRHENTWIHTDSIIASDSALVAEGYTRTNWLHERKSGGPDLRYSYNPVYESRIDTYAYSEFSIQLGRYKAKYSISKPNLSDKLKPMVEDYCSVMHELNAIPSLLRLLESVSKKSDAACLLSEKYESISKNIICKVS